MLPSAPSTLGEGLILARILFLALTLGYLLVLRILTAMPFLV